MVAGIYKGQEHIITSGLAMRCRFAVPHVVGYCHLVLYSGAFIFFYPTKKSLGVRIFTVL